MYVFENAKNSNIVIVNRKRYSYRRKYCSGTEYLEEDSHATFDYVFSDLSRETRESFNKRDKIRIFGTQSKTGFLVTGARKAHL